MAASVDYGRKFALQAAVAVGILSMVPMLLGVLLQPSGTQFLGYPYATDDHMVYAAWMRQAADGHFLFDNRFTTDAQPGLTIHLYFWILGLISKLTGIAWATTLSKAFFSGLFIWLTHKLVRRITPDAFATKLMICLATVGAGVGFVVWHQFGEAIVKPAPSWLAQLMMGRLPTDVWQPEGFVMPSMLTNSLFMVSLCLMLGIILALLECRENWKPVLPGALCALVLMNIHSYDVLLLVMVAIGFLMMMAARKLMTGLWLVRGVTIFAGAIPSAAWFLHVLRSDEVFQARAATMTYSPNFRQVAFGYLLLLILGVIGVFAVKRQDSDRSKALFGAGLFSVVLIAMFLYASTHEGGYFLNSATFAILGVLTLTSLVLLAREDATWNMLVSWAFVGIVAIYFPALFQRKLAMGLSIPWAILAGLYIYSKAENRERGTRNLVSIFAILVLGVTSIFWLRREIWFIRHDVTRTTVHPLYLTKDMQRILEELNNRSSEKRVVLAMPGVPHQATDDQGNLIEDAFEPPMLPDINPIISGLTGAYTYAGHWSETPQYDERRDQALKFFLFRTSDDTRRTFLKENGINYIVAPAPFSFGHDGQSGVTDATHLGTVVVEGSQYQLIKVE